MNRAICSVCNFTNILDSVAHTHTHTCCGIISIICLFIFALIDLVSGCAVLLLLLLLHHLLLGRQASMRGQTNAVHTTSSQSAAVAPLLSCIAFKLLYSSGQTIVEGLFAYGSVIIIGVLIYLCFCVVGRSSFTSLPMSDQIVDCLFMIACCLDCCLFVCLNLNHHLSILAIKNNFHNQITFLVEINPC